MLWLGKVCSCHPCSRICFVFVRSVFVVAPDLPRSLAGVHLCRKRDQPLKLRKKFLSILESKGRGETSQIAVIGSGEVCNQVFVFSPTEYRT